ncbi:MAG: hypothetical protein HYZ57_07985 [Acidobacteria bacterium]|nr:hypothetical protein [Acidobacteriota bacterium]MBI3279763.1 hypothetical protein [Acidobacteriota bacterium]
MEENPERNLSDLVFGQSLDDKVDQGSGDVALERHVRPDLEYRKIWCRQARLSGIRLRLVSLDNPFCDLYLISLEIAPPDGDGAAFLCVGSHPDEIEALETGDVSGLVEHAQLRSPALQDVDVGGTNRQSVRRKGGDSKGIVDSLSECLESRLRLRTASESAANDGLRASPFQGCSEGKIR